MKTVIVESPYAGDVEGNLTYLRACLRDCIKRGESPYASHALLTQPGVLDDLLPEERERGITAGYAWWDKVETIAIYTDRGWSSGMLRAEARAQKENKTIEYRRILQGEA